MSKSPVDSLPKWVSIQQTADYYGMDPKSVRRFIASGQLTARRIGSRVIRVDRDSILALMKPMGARR